VKLRVNECNIILNSFTQRYIENIVRGMVSSLGYSGRKIEIYLYFETKTLKRDILIKVDGEELIFKNDLCRYLVISTLKGMLSSIEGIPFFERIHILIH